MLRIDRLELRGAATLRAHASARKVVTMLSEITGTPMPASERSVSEVLAATALRLPDKLGIVSLHQDARLTWSQLNQRTGMLASGLFAMGLRRHDRVGICAWNCVEWVLLQ